jgi:hypothetical protein
MSRPILAVALFLAIVTAFAVAPAATAQAAVPTHDVGDAVGFGAAVDLGALAAPFLDQIRAQDAANDNITINELNFTGSMDIWATMEVVEETASSYTIREESAEGLRAHFVTSVTSNMVPAAGVHPGTIDPNFGCVPSLIPYTTGTSSSDIQITSLSTASGLSKWNVSDFALRESRTNYTLDLRATASLRNIPSIEFNATACETVVTYENSDITVSVDVDAELRVIFAPALDYFDFPILDNENWTAYSDATVGGRVAGTIDVTGLDPNDEEQFFAALNALLPASGFTVTGLTDFPINLQEITVTVLADTYLRGGVIDDISVPVALALHAREDTMTLADGNFHTVYLISSPPALGYSVPQCSWVYSPDDGFIVGYICEIQPGISIFELENVQPGTAEQEIADTKSTFGIGVAAANPLVDFFLKPPFLGLLLIIAAVVISILLVRRRGRRVVAPPVPPPAPPGA